MQSRLGEDGEIGKVFEEQTQVQLWYKFQETPCQLETFSDTAWAVAEEHAAAQQEDTQSQDLISSKFGAKHKLFWQSVQRKPNCTISKSVRRNNGTHIDVQRPRHTYERSGIRRCGRSPCHCGPTVTGQIEASGHQLFVDPRESCQG